MVSFRQGTNMFWFENLLLFFQGTETWGDDDDDATKHPETKGECDLDD